MKQSLLKMLALMVLVVTGNAVLAQETSVTQPTADTWVRGNSPASKGGTSNTLEVKTYTNADDPTKSNYFYALLSFEFTAPEAGNEVKSATLRLTTRYKKGDSEIQLFPIDCAVDEGSTDYNAVGELIESAKAGEPICSLNLKGDGNKAPTDAIAEAFQTVDAWQNVVDLTSYVKSLTGNRFTLLIVKPMDQNSSSQIFSREATDQELKNGSVFAATDLVPLLTVDYQEATGTTQLTAGASADTFVRKGNKTNYGSNPTMELYTYYNEKEDGSVEDLDFAGLMSLQLPAAPSADDELQSATLRLVTERAKGSIALYPYEGQWAENAIYEEQATAIAEARAKEAIATVKLAGQSNKAVTDNGVTMNTVEEWTNLIDVTNYVKSLNGNNVNLLIVNPANTKTSVKVYTKEAADVTLKDGSVFAAADLVPQLMLTYKKKAGGETGISLNKNSMDKAVPQGIYTMSGQRVSKATRGIYIMNGRKVVVK